MKPIRLKMTAFGPYKQSEVIDFNELQGNQLFVISGNTGAGKTTIFDGICFALYGSASGSDRSESRSMRSDFADDDIHTSVELVFEMHQRTYRILRQMGHVKKGNKSATGEKYEFFEVVDHQEVPCVERQIVSEINKKVEEIIGLDINQFSQIVMLPQGEFRKLLTSDTDNKEGILRKIFKTEPYKMISERLKAKKSAMEEELKGEQRALNSHIANIPATIPERESVLFNVLAQEHYNVHQIISGLDQEEAFYKEKIELDQKKYEAAVQKHSDKSAQFHQAKSINERFDECEQKEQRLAALNEQQTLFQAKEKQLEQAERASVIEGIERHFRQLQQEVLGKEQKLNEAIQAETIASEKLEVAEQQFKLEDAKEDERKQVSETLIRSNDFLPVVKEIDSRETELKNLQQQVAKLTDQVKIIDGQLNEGKASLVTLKKEIDALEGNLSTFDEKNEMLRGLQDKCRVLSEFIDFKQKFGTTDKAVSVLEQEYNAAHSNYKSMERRWFDNQARVLASHLHDGEACPVCGSLEHPNKNSGDESVSLTKEELEISKAALDAVEVKYREAAAKRNALSDQLHQKAEEVAKLDMKVELVSDEFQSANESRVMVASEIEGMKKDKESLISLKEKHAKIAFVVEELTEKKAQIEKSYHEANFAYEKSKAIYEEKIQAIPEELRVLGQLETRIASVERQKNELESAWKAAQQNLQDAKGQFSAAQLTVTHSKTTLDEAAEKKEKAEQEFKTAIGSSSFETEEEYQQAKLSEEARTSLKEEIVAYNQARHTLNEQVRELKESVVDQTKMDLTVMEAELAELKAQYETALQEVNRSAECRKAVVSLIGKITETHEKTEDKERAFNRIADLHDVVRGQNSLKISFERYLQIEYLEQIIASANGRLKNLSNGQFELIRSDRQEARGKQSGLGLDVYDAYTGQTRDVKTLSGGEKFNASLCLALGMADVIQSFQGNVSIDTMFIDEGFGSLDEESLNKSIDTLIDLQKSGRMIGVISHVQELKAAIPAILEVKKSREGYSQTRFLIK